MKQDKLNYLVRPLHNYVTKEKIEIVVRLSQKLKVLAGYWRNFWQKAGEFNHFLFVTLVMQRSLSFTINNLICPVCIFILCVRLIQNKGKS